MQLVFFTDMQFRQHLFSERAFEKKGVSEHSNHHNVPNVSHHMHSD